MQPSNPHGLENANCTELASSPVAFIVDVLRRGAEKIGATLLIEPEGRRVGQITYRSGVKRYFKYSIFDLNTMGASAIARDKGYTRFFLAEMGYPVPKGKIFIVHQWTETLHHPNRGVCSDAWNYAKIVGLPVFVKPNSLSRGVAVGKASTWQEFRRAAVEAMKHDRVIVVEKAVLGDDYRIVVLDGVVISAYRRIPLTVIGDGISSIEGLLHAKQQQCIAEGREAPFDIKDERLLVNLKRAGLELGTIIETGRRIKLLDNANLSSGGTLEDITEVLHPDFATLAINVSRDMGLRLAGVDLISNCDITQSPRADQYWIIEVNSAPGLDHYAAIGEKQKQIVEDLYLRVLKAMETAGNTSLESRVG